MTAALKDGLWHGLDPSEDAPRRRVLTTWCDHDWWRDERALRSAASTSGDPVRFAEAGLPHVVERLSTEEQVTCIECLVAGPPEDSR